jgi:hypothetical protein
LRVCDRAKTAQHTNQMLLWSHLCSKSSFRQPAIAAATLRVFHYNRFRTARASHHDTFSTKKIHPKTCTINIQSLTLQYQQTHMPQTAITCLHKLVQYILLNLLAVVTIVQNILRCTYTFARSPKQTLIRFQNTLSNLLENLSTNFMWHIWAFAQMWHIIHKSIIKDTFKNLSTSLIVGKKHLFVANYPSYAQVSE